MKTATLRTLSIGLLTSVAMTASAANTLISGLVTEAANWDTGLPDTLANIGIIDSDNTGGNQGLLPGTITDLFLSQTGGQVSKNPPFFVNHNFNNTQYEIGGGNLTTTTGLIFNSGSDFTISGGAVTGTNLTTVGATFSMKSGTLDLSGDFLTKGGSVHDISGGVITVGDDFFIGFQPTATFNFSGNATLSVTDTFGDDDLGVRLVNIGLGSGSISAATLQADDMTIDWTTGSEYSFTAASILDGAATRTWSQLWDDGALTIDGGQTGAFEDHFLVTGNTLSLDNIPEPSSFLLMALAGLGLAAPRRRR